MTFVRTRYADFLLPVLYFWIIFNQFISGGGADYCKMSSCEGNPHTMCKYPNSGPSSSCNGYIPSPLTGSEKNAIVNRHNKFRNKVADGLEKRGNPGPQPRAIDMTMLTWDDELAIVAQRWADQCAHGHDKCRNVDRFRVGQNIATAWSTAKINKKVEDLVNDWYDEVRLYSRYWVDSFRFGLGWGHYTQVVWAKTLTVGCGKVLYWDTAKRMNVLRFICNYGPAGNFRNEPVYVSSIHGVTVNRFLLLTNVLCYLKIR